MEGNSPMKKKRLAWGMGIAAVGVLVIGVAFGTFTRLLHAARGEHTGGGGPVGLIQSLQDMRQVAIAPKEGFPGQHCLTLLVMGIDDNWTNSDVVYTAQARTDTLFLLSLDLDRKKVGMLSIPRDTYTHIAGTTYSSKINSAYATGGPQRAIDTVDGLLGVRADHYLVLNIDSTKKMVGALGRVDVDVEHEMHYHDKWGHLSIDLKPGLQHLDADQAVGFARYRHGDRGTKPSPEDGDERRMYRQHVLMQAMVARAKTFTTVAQAPRLVDVAMSTIHTDLTRTQIFDIAAIFHGVQPTDICTASLTGESFRGPGGAWDYRLDMPKARAYTDWLVRGDDSAARRLVPVVVQNGTAVPGLARLAADQIRAQGFTDVSVNGSAQASSAPVHTTLVDTGVIYPTASADIAALLGLSAPVQEHRLGKFTPQGETPPALTVTLGQDYAAARHAPLVPPISSSSTFSPASISITCSIM